MKKKIQQLLFLLLLVVFNQNAMSLFAFPPIGAKVSITGNVEQLKFFFSALKKTKTEKVRVAHYGDSIIWGDVVTDHLRNYFQKKYGGHGIGFMSICNDDIWARKTITHKFSNDWNWASVFTKNKNRFSIGIAGTVAEAGASSSVEYECKTISEVANSFTEISLFYSNLHSNLHSTLSYKINSEKNKKVGLSSKSNFNVKKIDFGKKVKDIRLKFNNCDGALFYGVTLDSGNGIYVDNFSFRGNSGISLRDLDDKLLKKFAKNLKYKLFILQFGVNVVATGNVKYKWYNKMMDHVIAKIKKYFPKSSILLISPGDLGIKRGKKIITHPEIEKFIAVQEKIAIKNNIAFWNMFDAMGGRNSVSDWVKATPPLVFKDFCHLTWDGSEIISRKLIAALIEAELSIL